MIFLLMLFPATACMADVSYPLDQAGNTTRISGQHGPLEYECRVVNIFPHDPKAFTQGLVFEDGYLYEGTGLRGRSTLRRVDLVSGKILQIHHLKNRYFGEGIALFNDRIYQLTWKSKIGFIYDQTTFKQLRSFDLHSQGWGLTHNGRYLIVSDGSARLRFLHPESLHLVRWISVGDQNGPVRRLNELEYVNGKIFANVWRMDRIAIISPDNGRVTGWIDLKMLRQRYLGNKRVDVLNGIAYDAINKRLFVTGKLWPKLFEIEIILKKTGIDPAGSNRRTDRP